MVRGQGRQLVCVGATLLASLASAVECSAAQVTWQGPPECADRRETIEEAERLLGRSLHDVSSVDFEVIVTEPEQRRWTLRLVTVSRSTQERRERLLTGTSCDDVVAAAAVAMAMVVNGSEPETPESSPPPVEPAAAPAPTVESPPQSASVKEPRASGSPPLSIALSVALIGDRGSLPGFSLGGEIAASVRSRAWQLAALGAFHGGSREVTGGRGADFELAVGGLLGCGRWEAGPTGAAVCLGGEAGQLSGTGFGVRNTRSESVFWWAPRADASLSWPLWGPLSLLGRVGLALPQVRREFVVDDSFVYRPSALVVRGALGLELRL